jgi:hypothetical protein
MCYRLEDMDLVSEHPLSKLENYRKHHRLRVFYFFGTTCVACDIVGTKLLVFRHKELGSIHTDVYTDRMMLMTVDHIIPKSRGGGNTLENLQPMCSKCNNLKDNIVDISNEELGLISRGKKVRGLEVRERLSSIRSSSRTIRL